MRVFGSFLRALLAVPWMFLWLVPLVLALKLRADQAVIALVAFVGVFLWWNVMRPLRSRSRTAAMFRLRPWRQYAGWLSVAAVAQFAVALATVTLHEQLAEWRFLPRLPGGPPLIPPHFLGHALGPIAMLLAASVLTPLIEEFACRGKMQYRLERALGLVPAIVITAVIFSMLHGLTIGLHHVPFAVLVGWVVWRTGSIWTAVYVHAVNNFLVIVALYLVGESTTSDELPPWLWPLAIAVGFVGLCGLLAAARRIHRLAKDAPIRTEHNHHLAAVLRG